MTHKELIIGNVYIAENGIHKYIMKKGIINDVNIYIKTNKYSTNGQFDVWKGDHYTEAIPEQVPLLEASEKANKYAKPSLTPQYLTTN